MLSTSEPYQDFGTVTYKDSSPRGSPMGKQRGQKGPMLWSRCCSAARFPVGKKAGQPGVIFGQRHGGDMFACVMLVGKFVLRYAAETS